MGSSAFYRKRNRTRKESRSVECGQTVTLDLNIEKKKVLLRETARGITCPSVTCPGGDPSHGRRGVAGHGLGYTPPPGRDMGLVVG